MSFWRNILKKGGNGCFNYTFKSIKIQKILGSVRKFYFSALYPTTGNNFFEFFNSNISTNSRIKSKSFYTTTQGAQKNGLMKKNGGQKSRDTVPLKGQCHEIFDLRFFHQTLPLDPLSGSLEWFRFYFRIRRDIRIRKFEKCFPRCGTQRWAFFRVVSHNAEQFSG